MSDNSYAGINFNDHESRQIFNEHSKMMCPQYKNEFIFNLKIKEDSTNNKFIITGNINNINNSDEIFIKYSASNSPTYNSSFSGGGLPFPTEEIAFQNTPNNGIVKVNNRSFTFSLRYPNSYYINMGTIYVPPQVRILLVDKNNKQLFESKIIHLGDGIPFRTLTWPIQRDWNKGALFYKNDEIPKTVRTQYEILMDTAYPSTNNIPSNFWGKKTPC